MYQALVNRSIVQLSRGFLQPHVALETCALFLNASEAAAKTVSSSASAVPQIASSIVATIEAHRVFSQKVAKLFVPIATPDQLVRMFLENRRAQQSGDRLQQLQGEGDGKEENNYYDDNNHNNINNNNNDSDDVFWWRSVACDEHRELIAAALQRAISIRSAMTMRQLAVLVQVACRSRHGSNIDLPAASTLIDEVTNRIDSALNFVQQQQQQQHATTTSSTVTVITPLGDVDTVVQLASLLVDLDGSINILMMMNNHNSSNNNVSSSARKLETSILTALDIMLPHFVAASTTESLTTIKSSTAATVMRDKSFLVAKNPALAIAIACRVWWQRMLLLSPTEQQQQQRQQIETSNQTDIVSSSVMLPSSSSSILLSKRGTLLHVALAAELKEIFCSCNKDDSNNINITNDVAVSKEQQQSQKKSGRHNSLRTILMHAIQDAEKIVEDDLGAVSSNENNQIGNQYHHHQQQQQQTEKAENESISSSSSSNADEEDRIRLRLVVSIVQLPLVTRIDAVLIARALVVLATWQNHHHDDQRRSCDSTSSISLSSASSSSQSVTTRRRPRTRFLNACEVRLLELVLRSNCAFVSRLLSLLLLPSLNRESGSRDNHCDANSRFEIVVPAAISVLVASIAAAC